MINRTFGASVRAAGRRAFARRSITIDPTSTVPAANTTQPTSTAVPRRKICITGFMESLGQPPGLNADSQRQQADRPEAQPSLEQKAAYRAAEHEHGHSYVQATDPRPDTRQHQ
jgi:hypothetical protein